MSAQSDTATRSILGSMRADGSRKTVHPADVAGRFLTARRAAFALLIALYLLAPIVPVAGRPTVRLDVAHRRFLLFGGTFNAQDVWLLSLLALTFVFGLLFVTAWRGRVWCGWACPQTVFLEAVFRPIERWIEGPRERRLQLAAAPWTAAKLARRAAKLALFLVAAAAVAHAATALFVGPAELVGMIADGPAAHRVAFALTIGFTLLLLFNFGWFREQFCVVLCPYGRLQSVLHDRDSVTVGYDERRGEPRGRLTRSAPLDSAAPGDCVDCRRCVVVCPTAIDIRDGLQMECLACFQCADACDAVMAKLGRPRGLIRALSQREQAEGVRRFLRPRLALYGVLFVATATTLGAALALHAPFEANLLRPRGANPFVVDGAWVRNAYELHLVSKSSEPTRFTVRVASEVAAEVVVGTPALELAAMADARVPISVSIARGELARFTGPVELSVEVASSTGARRTLPLRFLAPPR